MKTQYFEFKFTHNGKELEATCYVYSDVGYTEQLLQYPIYRVAIKTGKINPPVFLFYEVNMPDKRFEWYPFNVHEELAMSIHEALLNCFPGVYIQYDKTRK